MSDRQASWLGHASLCGSEPFRESRGLRAGRQDRKSTRLNSSHSQISYAVFCLKNKRDSILITDFVNTTADPVFDGTLKKALAVDLGQSPYLNVFPEQKARQTLQFMGRNPDDRITNDVGREICLRDGIKALLTGSIASLGNDYAITIEAVQVSTGETLSRQQI